MVDQSFFYRQEPHSKVKSKIVSDYFGGWAGVMMRKAPQELTGGKLAYFDLYAGQGQYDDGSLSTPILILKQAITHPILSKSLITYFNDENPLILDKPKRSIECLENINSPVYPPGFIGDYVGDHIANYFENNVIIPSLFFIDPWGYKGLSLRLIKSVLRHWGCDCIFFFNYNAINRALGSTIFINRMKLLFGEEMATNLVNSLKGEESAIREQKILDGFSDALVEQGYNPPMCFRFKGEYGTRTKHFLMFISKEPLGYKIMREIFAKYSSYSPQGVPTFEYNPKYEIIKPLFCNEKPLDELRQILLRELSNKELTLKELHGKLPVNTQYLEKNLREVLIQLESEGSIVGKSVTGRRRNGTFPEHVKVSLS